MTSAPLTAAPSDPDPTTGADAIAAGWLTQLTTDEKIALLAGADTWRFSGIERLGIPALVTSDGPSGVRGHSFISGRSVSFPCATSLAATWDLDLIRDVGRALGAQARQMGVDILLAPTVNLHRHPFGGRNFECFSEDPLLTALAATAYVTGVESTGVACCVKHLVGNDTEFERYTIDSVIDDAVLRELYLVPFEAVVRAGASSVMAAYNRINGPYATESEYLLTQVLREEWGFTGVVVSDWYATQSTEAALAAGLDVEMPGPGLHRGEKLIDSVVAGDTPLAAVDRSALRVLTLISDLRRRRVGQPRTDAESIPIAVSRTAAARGMVLLKNDAILPVAPHKAPTIAIIGPGAEVGTFQGGGSGQVNPERVAGILPSLRTAFGPGVEVRFERGCVVEKWPQPVAEPIARTAAGEPGVTVTYRDRSTGEPIVETEVGRQLTFTWVGAIVPCYDDGSVAVEAVANLQLGETGVAELVFSASGRIRISIDGEQVADETWVVAGGEVFELPAHTRRVSVPFVADVPRRLSVSFEPGTHGGVNRLEVAVVPPDPPDLLQRAVAAARSADLVILVAHSPSGWEAEGRDRTSMALPGGQNELIAAVAEVNPRCAVVINAGIPVSMPWLPQVGAVLQAWLPGQTLGDAVADVLTGRVNPSGRLPMTYVADPTDLPSHTWYPGSDGSAVYGEGFEVGYRRLADEPVSAVFPFGYGMSYSTFELGRPRVELRPEGDEPAVAISIPVTHRDGPAGREVVQVYAASGWADRPVRELKGFGSIDLVPGEHGEVTVSLPFDRLRWWRDGRWCAPEGPIKLFVGRSSADLPHVLEVRLPASWEP